MLAKINFRSFFPLFIYNTDGLMKINNIQLQIHANLQLRKLFYLIDIKVNNDRSAIPIILNY